jgi:hypothetical protein
MARRQQRKEDVHWWFETALPNPRCICICFNVVSSSYDDFNSWFKDKAPISFDGMWLESSPMQSSFTLADASKADIVRSTLREHGYELRNSSEAMM